MQFSVIPRILPFGGFLSLYRRYSQHILSPSNRTGWMLRIKFLRNSDKSLKSKLDFKNSKLYTTHLLYAFKKYFFIDPKKKRIFELGKYVFLSEFLKMMGIYHGNDRNLSWLLLLIITCISQLNSFTVVWWNQQKWHHKNELTNVRFPCIHGVGVYLARIFNWENFCNDVQKWYRNVILMFAIQIQVGLSYLIFFFFLLNSLILVSKMVYWQLIISHHHFSGWGMERLKKYQIGVL